MKKTWVATGILTTLTFGVAAGAFASSTLTEVKAFLTPSVKVNASGKVLELKDEQGNLVEPLNYNGNIYLPVRGVAQNLGYNVYWNENNNTAYLSEKSDYLTFRANEELILKKYGYTLQVPASLGGKIRPVVLPQESLIDGVASGKLSKNVKSAMDILYLPQNPNGAAVLMATIEVLSQADWAAVMKDSKYTVLGTRGDNVYVLNGAAKNPFDSQSADKAILDGIVKQMTDNQYYLVLSAPLKVSATIASQVVGKWSETRKGTLMELTADGVLYRAGVAVGNYVLLDDEHIQFVADKQINTVTYKVDGDTLIVAEQTFNRSK